MSHYIIENPFHEYAVEFMKRIRDRFGYTPICLFTDARRRHYHERRFPILAELAPATRFDAAPEDLPALAAALRARYGRIVGLVPFREESLDRAPRLLELFGIDWNAPEVIGRFRDKHALKAHLALRRPGLRLNRHLLVRSLSDLDAELPARFVLKPNAGAGSAGVGVFRRDTPKAELARFLSAHRGGDLVLEEFVSGDLYAVDGLVDERGAVHVAGVFASGRTSANGSDVVYGDGWLVHRNTPLFPELAAYAGEVMAASELRRCPFHMEVMVDERGPCLIEVGARLVGSGVAFDYAHAHGGGFDFFDAAAHGYLSPEPYGDLGFDWDRYDSIQLMDVNGISKKSGLVVRARGVEEVERLPEFHRWCVKPAVGRLLAPTTDLHSIPYSVMLSGRGTLEELRAAGEKVKRMIELDTDGPFLVELRVRLARGLERARLRLGWLALKWSRWLVKYPVENPPA